MEQHCYALHFPRTYPHSDQGEEMVAPFNLSRLLSHGALESYAPATLTLQYLWYEEQPFFERPLAALRRYCEQGDGRLSGAKAIAVLKGLQSGEPPWAMDTFGIPQSALLEAAADPMRAAANYLIDAAGICSEKGLHFDPVILVAFARQNDDYFKWLNYMSRETELYDLPAIGRLVAESVDRWNELIAR